MKDKNSMIIQIMIDRKFLNLAKLVFNNIIRGVFRTMIVP